MAKQKNRAKSAVHQATDTGLRSTVGKALFAARRAITGIAVFSFFINLLMLTGPIYMLQVYDRVLISGSLSTLGAITVLMALMYLFMGFLEFCRTRVLARIALRFENDMGRRSFKVWLKQGLLGQSAVRHSPMNDLNTLKQFMSGNGPGAFFDLPWIFVYIAVIFVLHWSLGVLAVIGTLILICLALYNEFAIRKPLVESLKMRREEQAFVEQSHRNADAIAAMGMATNIEEKWARLNQKGAKEHLLSTDRSGGNTAMTKAFRMFIQSAILGLGGALAVQQIITPGAMIAGSIILGRALAPVQLAIGQWRGFTAARDSFARLNAFYGVVPEDEESLSLPTPTGLLSVEHLTAAPPGSQTAVLTNVNFTVKPGEGLGIIGPSASGKSTLARMLVGIWGPQKGSVRLDGATFEQWNADELGRHVGYLPQSIELFDGTISANIARFDPNAKDEDIVTAAKLAGVHELVLQLADGYDTYLGEGGSVLSGGQVQRIALARSLYGNPVLVVLDEPNASLDADGDMALTAAIRAMRKRGAAVIVIAHRPSAITAVDTLLVLRDGRQVAYGPKDQVRKEMAEANKKANSKVQGASAKGAPAKNAATKVAGASAAPAQRRSQSGAKSPGAKSSGAKSSGSKSSGAGSKARNAQSEKS